MCVWGGEGGQVGRREGRDSDWHEANIRLDTNDKDINGVDSVQQSITSSLV